AGPKSEFTIRLFRHDLDKPPHTEPEDVPWPVTASDYTGVYISRDGGFAVACQSVVAPVPVALLDLRAGDAGWRPFVSDIGTSVVGHVIGDEYIGVTTSEASRGRVVAISLGSADPSDPSGWRVIVPESDAVVRSVTPVGELLYVAELV